MEKKFLKKKNTFTKITVIFATLLVMVCYACRDELFNSDPTWGKYEYQQAIENAKAWYAANKPAETVLRSSGGGQMNMKAEWSHAFATKYDSLEVVETDVMSQGLLLFVDQECMEKYKETKDPNYKQCYTRMVFKTNKKTGETVGFLMTVAPNLEWLEQSKFKPFLEVTYLWRSKQFGGSILFHHIDGSFSNGWRYEKGKVVAEISSIDAEPSQSQLRAITITKCTSVPSYIEEYQVCSQGYMGGEATGPPHCETQWTRIVYTQQCTDVTIDDKPGVAGYGGGSGSGNGTPSNKAPAERKDCNESNSARNSKSVLDVFKITSGAEIPGENIKEQIDKLEEYTSQSKEYALSVQHFSYENTYAVMNLTADYINPNFFASGTFNNVKPGYDGDTYLMAHTHPNVNGKNPAPSPSDAMWLARVYNGGAQNITANVVFGAGGRKYMVYVDNRAAFKAFCEKRENLLVIGLSEDKFYSDSKLARDYSGAFSLLYLNGFSDNDAQSYALSYALDENNTGLKVSEFKDGTFKEQKTVLEKNGKYSPQICK